MTNHHVQIITKNTSHAKVSRYSNTVHDKDDDINEQELVALLMKNIDTETQNQNT